VLNQIEEHINLEIKLFIIIEMMILKEVHQENSINLLIKNIIIYQMLILMAQNLIVLDLIQKEVQQIL